MKLTPGHPRTAGSPRAARLVSLLAVIALCAAGIRLTLAGELAAQGATLNPTTAPSATTRPPNAIDFDRDIRSLLASTCYDCHGAKKQKGGLRLDVKSAALAGGTSGKMILPGQGEASPLVRRLRGLGDDDRMPLKHDPLPDAQIALISRWIDGGAQWPDDPTSVAQAKQHWSFVPPVRPPEPNVKHAEWPHNAIDRFILARLESHGIAPSPEAPKEILLRRLSLDLTGLLPTPKELDEFLADTGPDAYEKQVDRLLASPHYGERWGKHWLDQARYADSNGYSIDAPRSIWKYRDWVIDALNRDLPFDQFVIQQLAGDLLPAPSGVEGPDATVAQRVATGFHRNTMINEEGGIDPEQFRIEAVMDRVSTTGTVFLGLTVGCAQCHNHKFDPISQRDYYSLFAFFNNQDERTITVESPEDAERRKAAQAEVREADAALRAARAAKDDAAIQRAKDRVAAARQQEKSAAATTMVLAERKTPRPSFIFIKGDFTRPSDPVTPDTPAVLPALKPADPQRPNRLDLARWIVDPANPLTARVTVNRIWMHYFGHGLVETENDFGTQGAPPTHPELLDWLATELVRQNWSLKAIHKLIVTSAAYRQTSNARPDLANADPENKLLARQSRLRLDAEIVRDVGLCASGLLADCIGGPSVFPPQPEGVMGLGQVKREWKTSTGPDRYRRGLYTFLWRGTPHPQLTSFDAPDATSTCTRRLRSNTPLQALNLLNDAACVEFAQALAARALTDVSGGDDDARIDYAFRLCTARRPDRDEREVLRKLLGTQTASFRNDESAAKSVGGDRCPNGVEPDRFAAWVIVARAVLNLDETISRG